MGSVVFLPVVQNCSNPKMRSRYDDDPWFEYSNVWYSTKGYHIIIIQHRIGEKLFGVPMSRWREMRRWMENNLEGEILIELKDTAGAGHEYNTKLAYFELKSDAMAFKLTWMDHLPPQEQ